MLVAYPLLRLAHHVEVGKATDGDKGVIMFFAATGPVGILVAIVILFFTGMGPVFKAIGKVLP